MAKKTSLFWTIIKIVLLLIILIVLFQLFVAVGFTALIYHFVDLFNA